MERDLTWKTLVNAAHDLQQASMNFCQAHTLQGVNEYYRTYEEYGIKYLEKAAATLGYDLVKRDATPEAKEAA